MSELLSMARGLKDSYSLSNKQQKNVSSHGSPYIFEKGRNTPPPPLEVFGSFPKARTLPG